MERPAARPTLCWLRNGRIEFRPTLQRQRDHAEGHGQPERAAIFDKLIQQVDQEHP